MTRPRLAWRGAVPRRYEAVLNRCEAVLKEYDCGLGAVHKLCQPILEGSKLFESLNVFEYSYNFLYKKLFGHFFVSNIWYKYRVSFFTGPPPKSSKAKKLIWARLGVSGTIYVNVVSPILGFQYLNFLGEAQWKKKQPVYLDIYLCNLFDRNIFRHLFVLNFLWMSHSVVHKLPLFIYRNPYCYSSEKFQSRYLAGVINCTETAK